MSEQAGQPAPASRVEAGPPPPGMRRQLSQAVGWNVTFTPIKFIVDLLANLIKVHLLTRAEIGALSLISSATNSAGLWIDLGIDHALPKFIPEIEHAHGHGAVRTFLNRVVLAKLVLLAVALATLPWWGQLLLDHMRAEAAELSERYGLATIAPLTAQLERWGWVFLLAIGALLVLGAAYGTLMAYLISFFRQKAWNIITVGTALLLPLLTVVAVVLGLGILGVVATMVFTTLATVLATAFHVRRVMRQAADAGAAPLPAEVWRQFLPYNVMTFVMVITDYFSSQYFSVYWLDGLQQAALFWVSYSFIKQVQAYVYTPMVGIQVPLFARVRAEGDSRLPQVFGTLSRLLVLLLLPAGLLLGLFLHNLVLIQYPGDYAGAIEIGLILIPFLFVEPFWGMGHNILMVHHRYRWVLLSRLVSLSSIVWLALLVPRLGTPGAALAIGLGRASGGVVVLAGALRLYALRLPWRFAAKVLLASGLAAAVVAWPLLTVGQVPAGAALGLRLTYLVASVGLGLLALAVLAVALRQLRVLHPDDRALLGELRSPLVRRLLRVL